MSRSVVLLDNPVLQYRPNSSVPVNIKAVRERITAYLSRAKFKANDQPYYVPYSAVNSKLAAEYSIIGLGSLYGGVVSYDEHADKAILHELPDSASFRPDWYSESFAYQVQSAVLPGYTAFDTSGTEDSYDLMVSKGIAVRLKDPSNTGGLGQQSIASQDDLRKALDTYKDKMRHTGVVLEADLYRPVTITVAYVNIAGEVYTWYGRPYDVEHGRMVRFGGNELTVVRGGFSVLRKYADNSDTLLAIEQAATVFKAYDTLGSKISRATLDVVQGFSSNGVFMSGVTDPSLRPSASSAAEIRAIEALDANLDTTMAKTKLVYDYWKRSEASGGQEIFVSHPRMDIIVKLLRLG